MHFLSAHFLSELVETDLSGTHPAIRPQHNHHRSSLFPPQCATTKKTLAEREAATQRRLSRSTMSRPDWPDRTSAVSTSR